MIFRLPTLQDKEILDNYMAEHYAHGEHSITASFDLPIMPYEDWIRMTEANAVTGNEYGRSRIDLCFEDGRLIGLLSTRYELTHEQAWVIGHVGYGVRPTERQKGYASKMLAHSVSLCKDHGLSEVVVGCYKDNTASAATIRKCGGILVALNDNFTKGRLSQYYVIYTQ